MDITKEDIKSIFNAGKALGFAKHAGQPTIGLTFDEKYDQLVKNCSVPDVSQQRELLIAFAKHRFDKNNVNVTPIDDEDIESFLRTL